jgi:Ca2+/Na+ antiporter
MEWSLYVYYLIAFNTMVLYYVMIDIRSDMEINQCKRLSTIVLYSVSLAFVLFW